MPDSTRLRHPALALRALLERATGAGAWLVLPLALLLFAQWPLRDLVGAGSRQANDIAQWVFAIYVALALREATCRRVHMAAGLIVARYPARWQRQLARLGEAIAVAPWAAFVVVAGAASTWRSVVGLEAFPDTGHPLYFLVRAAAWLLALFMLLQALVDLFAGPRSLVEAGHDDGDAAANSGAAP